jgi:alpha-amylase
VGSGGTVEVDYLKGGKPVILVPDDILEGSRLCSAASQGQVGLSGTGDSNGDGRRLNVSVASTVFFAILVLLFLHS